MQNVTNLDHVEISARLFQPPHDYKGSCPGNAEDIIFNVCKDVDLSCRFYNFSSDAHNLIYFHGGNESSDSFDIEAESFNQAGINVLLTSYRGFGKSTGTPTVSTLVTDSEMLFAHSLKWLEAKGYTGAVFVMGRSLGSVSAIDVVLKNSQQIKGMVLESAICDIQPLLKEREVGNATQGIAEADSFNSINKITKIKNPTLIFHGSRDVLVPSSQVEKLQAASGAKNKQLMLIPGADHHTVAKSGGLLYFETIKGFFDTVCGVNTWRQRRKKFKAEQAGGTT